MAASPFVSAPRPGRGDDAFDRFFDAEIARVFAGLPIEPTSVPTPPAPPVRDPADAVPTAADLERIRDGLVAAAGTAEAKIVLFARFGQTMSASAIRYRMVGQADVRPASFATGTDPNLAEIWAAARERMGENV
ncbi:hypothetical protein [Blastomonas sp.]|uniref:hypothetical protein n=1 Tax=Blastomonas sp. TaxID=1909299 RepID=UPI0035940A48